MEDEEGPTHTGQSAGGNSSSSLTKRKRMEEDEEESTADPSGFHEGSANLNCANKKPIHADQSAGGNSSATAKRKRMEGAEEEGTPDKFLTHDYNVDLPVPADLRDQRWLARDVRYFSLGSSGIAYFGDTYHGKIHGLGRLMLGEGQYIEGMWVENHMEELSSCKLICDRDKQTVLITKRQDDYLLTLYESHFVASVTVDAIEELDFTRSTGNVKSLFFRKLAVLELVADGLEQKREAFFNKFMDLLTEAVGSEAGSIVRATIFLSLEQILNMPTADYAHIIHDRNIPLVVRDAAADLHDCEQNYLNHDNMFSNKEARQQLNLKEILGNWYHYEISLHRQMLEGKCPKGFEPMGLLSFIRSLPESKVVYVTSEDMDVFEHLASLPCLELYRDYFMDLVERYSATVHKIAEYCADPSTAIPIMPTFYGFLFKSFWEIISEIVDIIGKRTNPTSADSPKEQVYRIMLERGESGQWKLQGNIKWPENEVTDTEKKTVQIFSSSGNKLLLFRKALEAQYNVIFKMLTNFSPENYVEKKVRDYSFRVIKEELSWCEEGLKVVEMRVGLAERLKDVEPERLIWLFLLDDSLHEVVKDNPQFREWLKPYDSLLQGHISLIENSSADSHEMLRAMTHSIVKFITSSAPFFKEAQEKQNVDMEILVQQMWSISTAHHEMTNTPVVYSNFRDLVAEYNTFLNLRFSVNIEAASSGYFCAHVSRIMQTIMHVVITSLKKSVPSSTLVWYMRALNDFLDDFKNINFLDMYFVKSKIFDPCVMFKVDNNLTDGNLSYLVTDVEKFVQGLGDHPVPRHHIIEVVSQLLDCIATCLDKQWQTGDTNLGVVQLESTGLLLDGIRKSFMYLKEQPDYVDFHMFEKESTEPFLRLVRECETLDDLKKRISRVGESYWYIRKMDEIGIEQALEMFAGANTSQDFDSQALLDCYNLYLRRYDEYIATYRCVVSEGKNHAEGLCRVKQMLKTASPMHFSMWTEGFKKKEIPVLLAGLSAVWSLLVSKDVSTTGKFLKPHCVQILCILRLLNVNQSEGAENHLAQVLTGQGKSVVLGLLSSILALTGHKVKVLCYSDYLSSRDQNDFDELFRTFNCHGQVEYGTFENMADSFVNPLINGKQISLRQLVEQRVLNHESWPSENRVTPVSKNTVLLIDEVDIFFTDTFYGSSYFPAIRLGFPSLVIIQERLIWDLVQQQKTLEDILSVCCHTIDCLADGGSECFLELRNFINKPGMYPLLKYDEQGVYSVNQYTNKSLFDEHLRRMVDDAIKVRDYDCFQAGYKLDNDGLIVCRDHRTGIYRVGLQKGYKNVFNYFRLKKSNYDFKNYQNYGYLNLQIGQISYSRLPSQFHLLLGVSGTLTELGTYEKSALKFYGLYNLSVLPSFFGGSNLKFDQNLDFSYLSELDWLKAIYDKSISMVESCRAVIVFFESDTLMELFSKQYKTKFDRLNEITEETSPIQRDAYIKEAGLLGAVTLATRGMGRGVDYKSSLAVEKNGGVHVIQTFFSVDVKEEIQIRGRTARKDNKGSYELIVCREHLVRSRFVVNTNDNRVLNYQILDGVRKKMSDEKWKMANERVESCERNHLLTMKYFGLM